MVSKQRRRVAVLAACGAAISSSAVVLTRTGAGAHGVSMDFIMGALIGVAAGLAIVAVVLISRGGKTGAC